MLPTTTDVKAHHARVRALGCIIRGSPDPTIHHVHSGSVADAGWTRGTSQRGVSEALVLPLSLDLHSMGKYAIDGGFGVRSWEAKFGTQIELLDKVSAALGYDVFALALEWGYTRNGRKAI